MKSWEMVVVARLATHYDKIGVDALGDTSKIAEHDYLKFKREAPKLWQRLYDDKKMGSRDIGDWLYKFIIRWRASGMSLKNFAADELES